MNEIELAVVMPVYNESEIIIQVIEDWTNVLETLGIKYKIHVYNDGSKDNTLDILNGATKIYDNLIIHDKKNSGHGPTILQGYRENTEAEWIFQIDSDNELKADNFISLWKEKENFDFIIGRRSQRISPLPRQIISFISRLVVWLFYGKGVYDVNSPYRLMRTTIFRKYYNKIPEDTFAPNLIISGLVNLKNIKFREINVIHQPRKTGNVSINKLKLLKVSYTSFKQTILFKFRYNNK